MLTDDITNYQTLFCHTFIHAQQKQNLVNAYKYEKKTVVGLLLLKVAKHFPLIKLPNRQYRKAFERKTLNRFNW